MILNFIFSNLNAIALGVWLIFLAIVAIRFFQPTRKIFYNILFVNKFTNKVIFKIKKISILNKMLISIGIFCNLIWNSSYLDKTLLKITNIIKNISYLKLILIAIGLNIFYGLFVTWGQYYVWSNGSEMTKALLTFPLPPQVPISSYVEWVRPLFQNHLGYFLYYIWGRVWMDIFILFAFSGLLYSIFKAWKFYRGGFLEKGPELLLVLMLISGWMGVLVSLSIGFILAILWLGFSFIKGKKIVAIEPVFIFATFLALIFTRIILSYF